MTHLLVLEDDEGRREFVLNSPIYSMGKDPQCDVRLVSRFVSRHHATLLQLPNDDSNYYYRIVDGNLQGKTSANGLMINGRRFQAHNLQNEDEIVFGPQVRAIYYRLDEPTITPPPFQLAQPLPAAKAETTMREDIQYYNQALHCAQEGRWGETRDLLLKAIALRVDEAEYHSLLAVAYLGLQDRKLALEQFRLAYSLNAQDPLLQPYLSFIVFGEFDSGSSHPGYDFPPNSGSPFPRAPYPLNPNTGAEASPDYGLGQTP